MMKILYIFGGSHNLNNRNLNHHQRVYFLSRQTDLTILAIKNADLSVSAKPGSKIILSRLPGKTGLLLYGFWWVVKESRKSRFDLVLTEPSKLCLLGAFMKLITNLKWVVDVWDIPARFRSRKLLTRFVELTERFVFKLVFNFADLFIVSMVPDYELKYFHIPAKKMALFKNAIWLEDTLQKRNEIKENRVGIVKILCTRSYFTEDNGLDVLSAAFIKLRETGRSVNLTIVGKIPDDIENQVRPLRELRDVVFIDSVPHYELLEMIRKSTMCVISFRDTPDLRQVYPVKVLEYLAYGATLIVPSLDGITRIVSDDYNGLVYQAGDSQDLFNKMMRIADDQELRKRLCSNAKKLDMQYDCRIKADEIIKKLSSLVGLPEKEMRMCCDDISKKRLSS